MTKLQDDLQRPFEVHKVKFRAGATNQDKTKALALAYIDARDVMNRLDDVVGTMGWQDEYIVNDGLAICRLGIKTHDEWVWKSDGAGETDYEGEKGGISVAFKRAAVKFGIGRYLYSLPAVWVPAEKRGKSVIIKTPPKLPGWATPEGWDKRHEGEQEDSDGNMQESGKPAKATKPMWTAAQKQFVIDNSTMDNDKHAANWLNLTGFKPETFDEGKIKVLIDAYSNMRAEMGQGVEAQYVMDAAIKAIKEGEKE